MFRRHGNQSSKIEMTITSKFIHPVYLKEGFQKQFMCGYDIALAEVEVKMSTNSKDQIEELQSMYIPPIHSFDLRSSQYKFAFLCGYPYKTYNN